MAQYSPLDMGYDPRALQQNNPIETNTTIDQPRLNMDSETIKWQFNPADVLRDLERNLRGIYFNEKTNRLDTKEDARMVNEQGLYAILNLVRVHLYKHVTLSNFKYEVINIIVADVVDALIDKLEHSWDTYDIKKNDLTTIRIMVENTVRSNLLRALQGGAVNLFRDTTQFREVYGEKPARKKLLGVI